MTKTVIYRVKYYYAPSKKWLPMPHTPNGEDEAISLWEELSEKNPDISYVVTRKITVITEKMLPATMPPGKHWTANPRIPFQLSG